MVAKEIIGDIIKSHIEKSHYSQKEVSMLTGISEVNLSNLINGKEAISFLNSQKFSQVFDALKNEEDFLFKVYNELIDLDDENKEELEMLKEIKSFDLMDDFSKINIIKKNIDGNSFEKFEKFILNSSISFSKYKDYAKAKLWLILMYKKHKNIINENKFEKSTKKTVYKKVFNIFFKLEINIEERIKKIKNELWNRGIIVENGPYFQKSTIKGVSFIRKTDHFIFITDMYKRTYRWLISLIHELIHFYENLKDEIMIENYAIELIKKYIIKNNIVHNDFNIFFQLYSQEQNEFSINDQNKYFEELHKKTKSKISFGSSEDLIKLLNY